MADAPYCLCLAGPNGSGKSTAARAIRGFYKTPHWIDPDQVAERLRVEHHCDQVTDELAREAFAAARNLRVDYAERAETFGFETVFSHGSNLAFLRALRAIGYVVHLYFICTSVADINVARVETRVRDGGHGVPEAKIRKRYTRSLQLLSLAIHDMDRVALFDNSRIAIGGSLAGGRLVGDISSGGQLHLTAPIPIWVYRAALFPFADIWKSTPLFAEAARAFASDIAFDPSYLKRSRSKFLEQFRIQSSSGQTGSVSQ